MQREFVDRQEGLLEIHDQDVFEALYGLPVAPGSYAVVGKYLDVGVATPLLSECPGAATFTATGPVQRVERLYPGDRLLPPNLTDELNDAERQRAGKAAVDAAEEEARLAAEEAKRAAEEARAAQEAHDDERIAVDVSSIPDVDAAITATDIALQMASREHRERFASSECFRTLDGLNVVLLNFGGLRPDRGFEFSREMHVELPSDVVLRMKRKDFNRIRVRTVSRAYDLYGDAALIESLRKVNRDPLPDEKCHTKKNPATKWNIEQARADGSPHTDQWLAGDVEATIRVCDAFRARLIHPELAVRALIETRNERCEELKKPLRNTLTDEQIRKQITRCYSGARTNVAAGSKYREPPKTWLDAFYAKFPALDPKLAATRAHVADLKEVRTSELENALFAGKAMPSEGHRLHAMMTHIGWVKKKRPAEDGRLTNMWVRGTAK